MNYSYPEIQDVASKLKDKDRITKDGKSILRAPEFNSLFSLLKDCLLYTSDAADE